MSFSSKINHFRVFVMQTLTRGIGRSKTAVIRESENQTIKKVLICRPNSRLGNQLMITPLVQDVSEAFPNCKIDLFVRGFLAPIIFQNYTQINRIIRLPKKPFKELFSYMKVWVSLRKYQYDLVINVDHGSSSGRMSTAFSRGRYKLFCDVIDELEKKYKDYRHMAKFPVYNFRYMMGQSDSTKIETPIPTLDIKLDGKEMANGKSVLHAIVNNNKKTIAIYTFATNEKCYSTSWWGEFYEKLQSAFGRQYNIMEVLPIENVSQINFKAPNYYSRDIREIASVIANTEVFIGADSGMMHLASASPAPTVGLFSVTDTERYRPYNNRSMAVNTNEMSQDEIIMEINTILQTNSII